VNGGVSQICGFWVATGGGAVAAPDGVRRRVIVGFLVEIKFPFFVKIIKLHSIKP
jgi:hypothetical protein